jgi:(p)ppGpp synthase/HD superfamily hydrolase
MEITYGTKNDAITLAHAAHRGQTYGEWDYTKHLRDVDLQLGAAGFNEEYWDIAAWLHDIVEDTDTTIEQVESQFGSKVAMLVEAVTTPLSIGNRRARLKRLIELLTKTPGAVPLKLADRIANVQFCWFGQNTKLFMYYREYPTFRGSIRPLNDDPRVMKMWDKLDEMMGWWEPPAKGKK